MILTESQQAAASFSARDAQSQAEIVQSERMAIDFIGPTGSFAPNTYSFAEVLAGRISPEVFRGKLALIGAVVAEFVAGSGGRESGLAYRILESGYQLKIPRMFAALVLISLTGIAIYLLLSLLSHLLLRRWHESALSAEG